MASIQPKTYHAKAGEIERNWHLVDASGQTVGRLASRLAHILRGKHKPQWTPSVDCGDYVIIINAEKAVFTGGKAESKNYYTTTTRPGSMKKVDAQTLMQKNPQRVWEEAVWGMLPKGRLGRDIIRHLHVYAGEKHNHAAQNPQPLDLEKAGVG